MRETPAQLPGAPGQHDEKSEVTPTDSGSLADDRRIPNSVPEILVHLGLLQDLMLLAIALSLISLLISALSLLPRLRRRDSGMSVQSDGGAVVIEAETLPTTPAVDKEKGPGQSSRVDLPPPLPATPEPPPPRPVEKIEKPQPAPDEFTNLPHGAMGRALSQLHRALPDLARKIPDPRQQERFLAELDLPLKARIDRFKEAVRRGDAYLKEHWIEQDLVTTLNTLTQLLSSLIEERHRGRRGNRALEEELQCWLYERLAPLCQDEGWFTVEPILPFMTKFDPKIHYSVGSVPLDGAENVVVAIKAIGRRDPRQSFVTHKAEVIVGR
jgi:hypothetical protein